MSYIKKNIDDIRKKINNLNSDVIIVGVTKFVLLQSILEAMDAGLTDFGESKIQEAIPKIASLKDKNIKWHFIGHLQSNKINKSIEYFSTIQSIDSIEIAKKMSESLVKHNFSIEAFIEVKVSTESTKFGAEPEQVIAIAGEISGLQNINLKGLMAMAPYSKNPESARPYFKNAKSIFDEIKRNCPGIKMQYLSMGMTDDYIVAIEEGANMVRIGKGIFGDRNKNKLV